MNFLSFIDNYFDKEGIIANQYKKEAMIAPIRIRMSHYVGQAKKAVSDAEECKEELSKKIKEVDKIANAMLVDGFKTTINLGVDCIKRRKSPFVKFEGITEALHYAMKFSAKTKMAAAEAIALDPEYAAICQPYITEAEEAAKTVYGIHRAIRQIISMLS